MPDPGASPALPGPLRQLLAQVAQIYFQSSAFAGLVIIAALAIVRPWAAVGMLWASLVALAVARLTRLDRTAGESGLYGYNAALTGAGLLSMFRPEPRVFVCLTLVSGLAALLSARWLRWGRLPPLTLQFVVAMWGALWLGDALGGTLELAGCPDGAAIVPCGIGQVTFIAGALPGLCVWAALAWFAPLAGLWLGIGAALGGLGGLLGAEAQAIGLAVNVGLTAQALTVFGRGFVVRIIGAMVAAGLCLLCARLELPYFTLPFNLATWTLLGLSTAPAAPASAMSGSPGPGLDEN